VEYQVAASMVDVGMIDEALVICRSIHDRQQPERHRNPFSEQECGYHYSRAMASYAVYLALLGWEYHGPRGHLGFAPRLQPNEFRSAFTAAEGWGTISQQRTGADQIQRIKSLYGRVQLETLAFELPARTTLRQAAVLIDNRSLAAKAEQDDRNVSLALDRPVVVEAGQTLEIRFDFN
jgi:hypothetical protein